MRIQVTFEWTFHSCVYETGQEAGIVGVLREPRRKRCQRVGMLTQLLKCCALPDIRLETEERW